MLRYGIHDYQPRWLNGRGSVIAAHGPRLAGLAGLTLQRVWLVWDLNADEWFTDAPVLLDFGARQLEIDHQKFDDLSITWDTIDPSRAIEDPYSHLAWRAGALPPLAELSGRVLDHIELLEYSGDDNDLANGSVAVGFDFGTAWLTIFNALDENGFQHHVPGPCYRRHRIRGAV